MEAHTETSPLVVPPGLPEELRVFDLCGIVGVLGVAFSPAGEVVSVTPALQSALRLTGEGPYAGRLSSLLAEEAPEGFEVKGELELHDGSRFFVLAESYASRLGRLLDSYAGRHHLTAAERAALAHVAEGLSAKVSAGRLQLSPETVRARRKRIFRKVDAEGCGAILAQLLREQG